MEPKEIGTDAGEDPRARAQGPEEAPLPHEAAADPAFFLNDLNTGVEEERHAAPEPPAGEAR